LCPTPTSPDSSGIAVLGVGVGCGKATAIRTDSGTFLDDERQTFRSKIKIFLN